VSDWDLLVVVESEAQVADVTQWGELERRVRERERLGQTPLTLSVHDIKFVNREIRVGQYFFGDRVPREKPIQPRRMDRYNRQGFG